jgi:ubiquinone/menaquinone biosynthesis C-methylase UbiE
VSSSSNAAQLVDSMLAFYSRFSRQYDGWATGLNPKVAARLVDFTAPDPSAHVLDIGTGTGLVAHEILGRASADGLVIGIDISEAMLAVARSKGVPAHSRFMVMDGHELVFRKGMFDLVTLGQSLSYLIDPEEGLKETLRVLKPGGRVALSLQSRELITEAQELFFKSLGPLAQEHFINLPRHAESHARLANKPVLKLMLERAGFVDVQMTQLVTGGRGQTPREWTDLMAGLGPLPFTLMSVLGPRHRQAFEAYLVDVMTDLGDEAFRYHFNFLIATATKPA